MPKDYEKLVKFYNEYRNIYNRIWSEAHVHFGLAPMGSDDSGKIKSMHDAGVRYTNSFLSMGTYALPVSRFQSGDLTIVELCCGWSPVCDYSAFPTEDTASYIGVDVVEEHIAQCRAVERNSPETFRFAAQSAESWLDNTEFRPGTVDMVVCQDSFYLIRDKDAVLEGISRILSPGGIFLISDLAIADDVDENSEFYERLVLRQGGGEPLSFVRDSSTYALDEKLQDHSFFLPHKPANDTNHNSQFVVDRSESLKASYEFALERLDDLLSRSQLKGEVAEKAQEFQSSFKTLHRAIDDKYRLRWRVATRKSDRCPDGGNVVKISIPETGFGFSKKHVFLDQMNFHLGQGEYVWLIGKNGSGKTTLVRAIQDWLTATGIEVTIADGLNVVLVEQDPALLESFSVREAIEIVHQASRNRSALNGADAGDLIDVADLLAEFNLEALASQSIQKLSGGETQRASIALAVAADPDVLLLDEPLAAQDFVQRRHIFGCIRDYYNERPDLTILHISHQWYEFNEFQREKDRVLEVSGGQLVDVDSQ